MSIDLLHKFSHLIVCVGVVVACVCRLNNEVCRKYKRARLRVVLMMGAVLFSIFQGVIFGSSATYSETFVVVALLVSMAINANRWMNPYLDKKEV